jgi:hypothetical protein
MLATGLLAVGDARAAPCRSDQDCPRGERCLGTLDARTCQAPSSPSTGTIGPALKQKPHPDDPRQGLPPSQLRVASISIDPMYKQMYSQETTVIRVNLNTKVESHTRVKIVVSEPSALYAPEFTVVPAGQRVGIAQVVVRNVYAQKLVRITCSIANDPSAGSASLALTLVPGPRPASAGGSAP